MQLTAPPTSPALVWRPMTTEDVPAWHRLLEAMATVDKPNERYTLEDLNDALVDGSWKDPSRDTVLGLDAEGTARAFGQVEVLPGDVSRVRAFCWGGVDPQWRGRGIGRSLLTWQEALGRARINDASAGIPGRVLVYVEDHREDTHRLVGRAGFAQLRWFVELTRPLEDVPAPITLGEGLRVVPYDAALSEAVRHAHNDAFADHWGSEPRTRETWERNLVGGRHFRPAWSFVALDGEEVAGYCLTSAYEQDWAAQGYTSGWTDLLGVRRQWRRRGVGRALLNATLRTLGADGIERAELDVDTDNASRALDLYTGLGYTPVRQTVVYGKDV